MDPGSPSGVRDDCADAQSLPLLLRQFRKLTAHRLDLALELADFFGLLGACSPLPFAVLGALSSRPIMEKGENICIARSNIARFCRVRFSIT